MKKPRSRLSVLKEKVFLMVIILELLSLALTAQDAVILEVNSPISPVYTNQEVDLSITLSNMGEVPMYDGLLSMEIWIEEDLVFELDQPINELRPGQIQVIYSFPETWSAVFPGVFMYRAEVQFEKDINPVNNVFEVDFKVINPPSGLGVDQDNKFNGLEILNNPGSIYDPVRIKFELPESRFVEVKIFDMQAQKIFEKRLGYLFEGSYEYELYTEGMNSVGNYVLVLFAEDRTSTIIFVRM